jgi:hypothetical protein
VEVVLKLELLTDIRSIDLVSKLGKVVEAMDIGDLLFGVKAWGVSIEFPIRVKSGYNDGLTFSSTRRF